MYMYLHFPWLKTSSFVASDRRLGIGAWTTWSLIGGYISSARGISTSLDVKSATSSVTIKLSTVSPYQTEIDIGVLCYRVEERSDVLGAINEFLDESVVLPPSDYSTGRTLDLLDVGEIRHLATRRRKAAKQASAGTKYACSMF